MLIPMNDNERIHVYSRLIVGKYMIENVFRHTSLPPRDMAATNTWAPATLLSVNVVNCHNTKVNSKQGTIAHLLTEEKPYKIALCNSSQLPPHQPNNTLRPLNGFHTSPNTNRIKITMSEDSNAGEETDLTQTITNVQDEMNAIHVKTFKSRKTLKKRLARFEQHCEDIDGRLDRIEQLLLKAIAMTEANAKVPQKLGRGTFVEQDIDESNTKTIAGSRPERAKRAVKEPVRYKPEGQKSGKGKVEIKEEEGSDVEKLSVVDPKKKKKRKATDSDQEETTAAPPKKKSKTLELTKVDEFDEIDERDHIPKAKKSKKAKRAAK